MTKDSIAGLQQKIRAFAIERDWEQFHSPANLAAALSVEAGELLEHFIWLSAEQSASLEEDAKREVAMEMADVFVYLLRMADVMEVDLLATAEEKIALNAKKYPVEKARGSARKYTAYQDDDSGRG